MGWHGRDGGKCAVIQFVAHLLLDRPYRGGPGHSSIRVMALNDLSTVPPHVLSALIVPTQRSTHRSRWLRFLT